MKIALCGSNGKMGKEFMRTFSNQYEVIEIHHCGPCLNDIIHDVKLVIDFTNGRSSFIHGIISLTHNVPIIIGSTGISFAQKSTLKKIADSRQVGCIISNNFSIGMQWIKQNLSDISSYFHHIQVIEEHHRSKLDSPSGTALTLQEILKIDESNVIAIRSNKYIVKHKIILENDNESIIVEHIVKNRSAYMIRLGECMKDIFRAHSYVELK